MEYDAVASYYDLVHGDFLADISFMQSLIKRPGQSILELGCGTGRVLLPLAQAGHHLTGVDSSRAMLAVAERKIMAEQKDVSQRVRLIEAEMTSLNLNSMFDIILASHNLLMHLDGAALRATLECVARHLGSKGVLFIDLENPFSFHQSANISYPTVERTLTEPETNNTVTQISVSRINQRAQSLDVTWIYEIRKPTRESVQRLESRAVFHYYYPHEIELALNASGLRLKATFGDYGRGSFSEDSERLLILASSKVPE